MRTVRFRAWDGKKMWRYAVPLLTSAYNGGMINVSDNKNGSFNQFIKGELMQFTEIYDRKGYPIYENDIIYSQTDNKHYFIKSRSGVLICNIDSNILLRDIDKILYSYLFKKITSDIQVVGNIYQNP